MIRNLARGRQVFTSNVFLVTGGRNALVDVGNEFDVVAAATDVVDTIDTVVLTHTHYDHVANLDAVVDAFDAEVLAYDGSFPGVNRELTEEETIALGDHEFAVIHTPGHKNDHVCLYADGPEILFAGDLVFANGGFGRTDLDEGDRPTLIRSIRRILDVTDETLREMHTGHGPSVETDPYHHVQLALQAAQF